MGGFIAENLALRDEPSDRPNSQPVVLWHGRMLDTTTAQRNCLPTFRARHVRRFAGPHYILIASIVANLMLGRSAPAIHRDRYRLPRTSPLCARIGPS